MRQTASRTALSLALLATATMLGCGTTPTAALKTTAVAPAAKPVTVAKVAAAAPKTEAPVAAAPTITLVESTVPDAPTLLTAGADPLGLTAPAAPSGTVIDLEDAPLTAKPTRAYGESQASYYDAYQPYGISASRKTKNSLTLVWYTTSNTRSNVYVGQTSKLDTHGYTQTFYDGFANSTHWVTVGGLKWFTRYTVQIVGIGPYGNQSSAYPVTIRTGLF